MPVEAWRGRCVAEARRGDEGKIFGQWCQFLPRDVKGPPGNSKRGFSPGSTTFTPPGDLKTQLEDRGLMG
ncbi:unnamed protein product [Linum trigynum]|uniref:Uncharacterized protein n=1 Tax=Linum trigynum TaxID=586398 RepID=A0AAV2DX84_9ROSI